MTIRYYKDGYCYYRVPVRHFTDTETPWYSPATADGGSPTDIYLAGDNPYTAEARYLGRYGVVRNNWYTISIRSVTHVGSPIIPALTANADDEVEQLLNATLTINGWTTNEQNLE